MLSWNEITNRALEFSKKWKDAKDEKSEAQSFLNDFFNVFGVDRKRVATFESKVPKDESRNGYIDLLWKGVILIEMKSTGKSLDRAYKQAKDYEFKLEDEELPEYVMVCDFKKIRLYRDTTGQKWEFETSKLYKNIKKFAMLTGNTIYAEIPIEKEVDKKAAEKMAKLHDILKSHGYEGHNLELYLVRLLFCLFADDTGLFEKNIFFDYISNSKKDGSDLYARIEKLFEVLDLPYEAREKKTMLSDELKRFAYVNGQLFSEHLPLADFDSKMRQILLECCSSDWGYISPAIFGAMFQGVMNPQERHDLGAHYTSEENILKVIKPLFLDELREEFEKIKTNSQQLKQFHEKISKLKFLDPACGCGNFLIITYRELRLLELDILKMLINETQQLMFVQEDFKNYFKVNVEQFYGIEYEEFPCQIARVGMWLMDHQMNNLVSEHFGHYMARLPLTQSATIVHGNALRTDWESVVAKNELSYIFGNPPFVGARIMNAEQKQDLLNVFGDIKGVGNLDYVTAWYKKAADYMINTFVKTAFVSTNSITQGEQVPILWKLLIEKYKVQIDFAYRTFKWGNEAKGKAAVHCVIVGFSINKSKQIKVIYDEEGNANIAENINPYLVNAVNIFIENRGKAISNSPFIETGNQRLDNDNFIFTEQEKDEFIKKEPLSEKWFKPWIGSREFIHNELKYCLWLRYCPPQELSKMPLAKEILQKVKEYRLSSDRNNTNKLAETPTKFQTETFPKEDYLVIPVICSEKRNYIPIGYVSKHYLPSNQLIVVYSSSLYDFGILTSNAHMAWMRTVAGRLKSDYRYSKDIVYNNFPWPDATDEQKQAIEKAAQGVLDARALYPESSLADLYDPLTMPIELKKAHDEVDKAVKKAYGGKGFATEAERVADLMERYLELTKRKDE